MAEQLEHIQSDDLVSRLEIFLGFPSVDPHGDPIPDTNGRVKSIQTQKLTDAPEKRKLTILALGNTSDHFLKYLDKLGLFIGAVVEVLEIEPFDHSVTLQHKKNLITISNEAAENLLVSI